MKTVEEPNAINEEVKTLNKKPAELREEELTQTTGGANSAPCGCASCNYGSKEECTYYRAVNGHTPCNYT